MRVVVPLPLNAPVSSDTCPFILHSFWSFISPPDITAPQGLTTYSSASCIMLLFPSSEFSISVILFSTLLACLIFKSSIYLLNVSCNLLIFASSFFFFSLILDHLYHHYSIFFSFLWRLLISSSLSCFSGVLSCSFICLIFLCLFILYSLLCCFFFAG